MCARPATSPRRTRCACASSACPTRSPRTSTTARPTSLVARRACAATSRSPASRPTCTSASRPRACSRCASRSAGTRRARLDAVARRQRDPQGARRLPPHRDAAVQPRVLRPLRPAVDQPRADRGRRRLQQGPRPLHDGRRHPLPARARTPARSCARSARSAGRRDRQLLPRARRRSSRATTPYVLALRDAVGRSIEGDALSIGRDGASDAISFLEAGIPAVEFGPVGGGHHGPRGVGLDRLAGSATARRSRDFVRRCRRIWLRAPGRTAAAARRRRRRLSRGRTGDPAGPRTLTDVRLPRATRLPAAASVSRRDPDSTSLRARAWASSRRPPWRASSSCCSRPRRSPPRRCSRSTSSSTSCAPRARPIPGVKNVARRRPRRRAADDPRPRLRPPLPSTARQGQPGALGHDDARPPGPRSQGGHRGACRSRATSRCRSRSRAAASARQDQRGLLARRPERSRCARSATCSASRSTTSST